MGKLLGDAIADITTALGIRPCDACKKRQETLNNLHRRVRGGSPKAKRGRSK